jgi:hypothetical protein
MNDLQDDEAEVLRRQALILIGNCLRDYCGDVMKEGIPNRLTDLLQRLLPQAEPGCDGGETKKRAGGR